MLELLRQATAAQERSNQQLASFMSLDKAILHVKERQEIDCEHNNKEHMELQQLIDQNTSGLKKTDLQLQKVEADARQALLRKELSMQEVIQIISNYKDDVVATMQKYVDEVDDKMKVLEQGNADIHKECKAVIQKYERSDKKSRANTLNIYRMQDDIKHLTEMQEGFSEVFSYKKRIIQLENEIKNLRALTQQNILS